jgi:hypothetical protein
MTKEDILRRERCLTKISELLTPCESGKKMVIYKKHPEFDLDYTVWELKPKKYKTPENDYHLIKAANKYWNLINI